MSNLYYRCKKYLEDNGKTDSELNLRTGTIALKNDGAGDYIASWNVSGVAKPTDEQLASYSSEATTDLNNNIAIKNREQSYGKIGDQLDMLYKDLVAGKADATGEWAKKIKAIKDANPKS